jgi:acyl phosphate:glycerol-3-phosphate acyltransferase
MMVKFILMLAAGYLVGSITAAYFLVKIFKGVDIRKVGTGTVGSSNVAHTTSKGLAVPIALFDMAKGMLVFWLAGLIGLSVAQQMAVGFAVIVGHDWPLYVGFKGGKGMITTLGVIFMVSPLLSAIILFIAYSPAIKRHMAEGVAVALISLPLWTWFGWSWLHIALFGQQTPITIDARLPVTIGFIAMVVLAFVKRLIGPRVALSKDVPTSELIMNRLMFDRDIRDRRTWIDRSSAA